MLLYRYDTGDAPTTKTYTLSTDEDLSVSDVYGNVSFVRAFKDDYYNTLILPFKIEDYKSVFGINVSAYELQKVDHNDITFKAVETICSKENSSQVPTKSKMSISKTIQPKGLSNTPVVTSLSMDCISTRR